MSEIKAVWPPRNDKRDAVRAATPNQRRRSRSIPLTLDGAIEISEILGTPPSLG